MEGLFISPVSGAQTECNIFHVMKDCQKISDADNLAKFIGIAPEENENS